MALMMCPHCGKTYPKLYADRLVPVHKYPNNGTRCPGSEQTPRNSESDRRPLWKDEIRNAAAKGNSLAGSLLALEAEGESLYLGIGDQEDLEDENGGS